MANIKISALTAAGSANGTQTYEVTDGGNTYKVTGAQLLAYIQGNLTLSNISDVTATAAELNKLDGATVTTTELNYVGGVTSAIQTQLDAKAPASGATLTNPTFTGTPVEDVYTLSGTSLALEPDNGSVQLHTLSGNTTYTDGFSNGQGVFLIINSASSYTVTWPTIVWLNNGGTAPTINASGYTSVSLIKAGGTLYAMVAGDQS